MVTPPVNSFLAVNSIITGCGIFWEGVLSWWNFVICNNRRPSFFCFASTERLSQPWCPSPKRPPTPQGTTREAFVSAHVVSAYSLVSSVRHALPFLSPGASVVALTYIGSQRVSLSIW